MMMGIVYLFVIAVLLNINEIKCDQWEYDLIHSILNDYDMSIRPSIHHNATLNITFGLALTQLIDVDERNMIITTNCWLNQNWIDHKLKWDPKKFNNIKSVHIPAGKIWKPDIILLNNADSWARTSSISTNAIVKHNGNVTWLSTVIFKSSCSINVRYFPFDEQKCEMVFASWSFHGYFLDVNINSNEGDVTNYIQNGEWHLYRLIANRTSKNYSCCEEPYPEVNYTLIIRRRPLYYVFNMVFPCLLITLVAFLGFYLPPGSSEKVSIGITTLLSITVFLMLVAESMPPTSEQLPLLGIYYAVTIGIVSFSTAMAVLTLNINNKGNKGRKVPRLARIIFFNYLAKILRTELSHSVRQRAKKNIDNIIKSNMNSLHTSIRDSLEDIRQHTHRFMSPGSFKKYQLESKLPSPFIAHDNLETNEINIRRNDNLLLERTDNKTDTLILKSTPIYRHLETNNSIKQSFYSKPNETLKNNDENSNNNCNQIKENYHETSFSSPDVFKKNRTQNQSSNIYNSCSHESHNCKYSLLTHKSSCKQQLLNFEFLNELERILVKQFNPLIENITTTIHRNEKKTEQKEKMEIIQDEWSDVAMIFDHILCYFFSIITLVSCFLIFFNSPHVLSEW